MVTAASAGEELSGLNPSNSDVRTVFVSDVHLGCTHARADRFLEFLNAHSPDYLYLVGDIIDGWRLRRMWHWTDTYDAILQRMVALADSGTRLFYTPGNHDEFMRSFPLQLGGITVAEEFVHETADQRRFLVTHGDRFDKVEQNAKWMSVVATFLYEVMLYGNRFFSWSRGRKGDFSLCAAIKGKVKWLVQFFSDFEKMLAGHANQRQCDGVICGHIHRPNRLDLGDVTYLNTGDWIEHSTALVEYHCGTMQLVEFDGESYKAIATVPPSETAYFRDSLTEENRVDFSGSTSERTDADQLGMATV
ncbi:UDP-2,3-diacylglucosamine diphosphatase [Calycomorphotria hydatis]|uniref:UDP-2,3-diacylglucosamine hydrolase n=1 Tax=Calycomorphotria hydatis TaxID=2528027 RepID=A0A517TBU1_9PLAN|nr:UDP-2,3-diacylglucosamine diphosphatase [Calycomorphotria hydatis]QDT65845.1 UDP-2,3-diacylglucosamine hydrolase [Calycomorphotria hydatis]